MNTATFLRTLLPGDGFTCLVSIEKADSTARVKHIWSQSVGTLVTDHLPSVLDSDDTGLDYYFGLGSYESATRRAGNLRWLQSFWLDIDAKDYPSPEQCLESISRFVNESGVAEPTYIVDSGGGYHLYWALSEPISADLWRSTAEIFRLFVGEGAKGIPAKVADVAATIHRDKAEDGAVDTASGDDEPAEPLPPWSHVFNVDHSRTTDAASILRLPGSLNHKYTPAREVEVVREGPIHSLEDFVASIQAEVPVVTSVPTLFGGGFSVPLHAKAELDDLSSRLYDDKKFSAEKILLQSIEGTGCDIFREAYEDQANTPEQIWQALMSVLVFCDDGEAVAHFTSMEHPNYTHAETAKKFAIALQTKRDQDIGPRTCTWFNKVKPKTCAGCVNFGRVKTPLSIGIHVEAITAATPLPPVISTASHEPSSQPVVHANGTHRPDVWHPSSVKLPRGYKFAQSGGVYKEVLTPVKDSNGATKMVVSDVEIFAHPVYLVNHVSVGDQRTLSVSLCSRGPNEKPRVFTIPNSAVAASDKLRDALADNHLVVEDERLKLVKNYLQQSIKLLQESRQAGSIYERFGWHADDGETKPQSFVLGDRVYRPDGSSAHAEISSGATQLKMMLRPAGDRADWNRVKMLYEHPDMRALHGVIAIALASPFYHLADVEGIWINIFSSDSGRGKTSLLKFCNSLYGNPSISEGFMLSKDDTLAARTHRMGMLSHIIMPLDEVTNMEGAAISDQSYLIFTGRPKNRLASSANIERSNPSRWKAPLVSTSNQSLPNVLRAHKAMPDGEMARILEFQMPPIVNKDTWTHTSALLDSLNSSYGHFAADWLPLVVSNQEAIKELIYTEIEVLSSRGYFAVSERYWLKTMAMAMVATRLVKAAGMLDLSEKAVEHAFLGANGMVTRMREQRKAVAHNSVEIFTRFVNEHLREMLVLGAVGSMPGLVPRVVLRPNGTSLSIRVEEETQTMYIDSNKYKKYLAGMHLGFNEHVRELQSSIAIQSSFISLGEGASIYAPASAVLKVDISKFAEIRSVITEATSISPETPDV